MKITFNDNVSKIKKAISLAKEILENDNFYTTISEKNTFYLSTATSEEISKFIKEEKGEIMVEVFCPRGLVERIKYRKTLAFYENDIIFFNLRKLNRSDESIAATLIHEIIHFIDDAHTDHYFGHGSNSKEGKNNTAPYWIGNLAYKMLTSNKDAELVMDDETDDLTII